MLYQVATLNIWHSQQQLHKCNKQHLLKFVTINSTHLKMFTINENANPIFSNQIYVYFLYYLELLRRIQCYSIGQIQYRKGNETTYALLYFKCNVEIFFKHFEEAPIFEDIQRQTSILAPIILSKEFIFASWHTARFTKKQFVTSLIPCPYVPIGLCTQQLPTIKTGSFRQRFIQ